MKNIEGERRKIILFPIGNTNQEILSKTAAFLEAFHEFSFCCSVTRHHPIPIGTLNRERQQYDCKRMLKHLLRCCPNDCFRLIGITEVDVYVPALKYVFGLAKMAGNCAIISTYRLRPEFYAQKQNQRLFFQRIYKTVLHELGHTLGLTHCNLPTCVMYSSSRIEDTDKKKATFCETCSELFSWYLSNTQ